MITLKLTRDEARFIEQQWLPYMIKNAWSLLRNNTGNHGKYLNCKMLVSLLTNVHQNIINILDNKDTLTSIEVKVEFDEAEASAFYLYLPRIPIEVNVEWKVSLRKKVVEHLYEELYSDMPEGYDSPTTLSDFLIDFIEA